MMQDISPEEAGSRCHGDSERDVKIPTPVHLDFGPVCSPPVAPPLPPTKTKRNVPRLPPVPLDAFSNILNAEKLSRLTGPDALTHTDGPTLSRPFKPCVMFFYGTLMDPEILQNIVGLSAPPVMESATITGFKIKMWGIYPALIPGTECTVTVSGMIWKVADEESFQKLEAYETDAYTWCKVDAQAVKASQFEDAESLSGLTI